MLVQYDDDVIKWKPSPRYWPFVQGINWSSVNSPPKGRWRWAFIFGVFFDLGVDRRLSKESSGWSFETPSRPCNVSLKCVHLHAIARHTSAHYQVITSSYILALSKVAVCVLLMKFNSSGPSDAYMYMRRSSAPNHHLHKWCFFVAWILMKKKMKFESNFLTRKRSWKCGL